MALINRPAARRVILNRLQVVRPALAEKLTRVSARTYEMLEIKLVRLIDRELEVLPTVGKTVDIR